MKANADSWLKTEKKFMKKKIRNKKFDSAMKQVAEAQKFLKDVKKKVRKPRQLQTDDYNAWVSVAKPLEELGAIYLTCDTYIYIYIKEIRRLRKWLTKAIAYLEQEQV